MAAVSVIVPNYNHASYLPQRLESIFRQTYPDYEVIILDDASTDTSLDIIKLYRHHPQCRVVTNKKNSGSPFAQWNKGTALTQGELIWIAESDDVADPHFLEKLTGVLLDNPRIGIAYCQSHYINEQNNIVGTPFEAHKRLNSELWKGNFIMKGCEMLTSYMVIKNLIPSASAVVFRKSLYEKAGGTDENLKIAGDWMLWSKMLLHSDIGFIAEPLNGFRVHQHTIRSTLSRQQQMFECAQVQQFICHYAAVSFNTKTQAVLELSKYFLQRPLRPQPGEFSIQGFSQLMRTIAQMHGYFGAAIFGGIGLLSLGTITCFPSFVNTLQKAYKQLYAL